MAFNLEDDFYCYACGKDNPVGLKLQFTQPAPGKLSASVTFSREHQGYKGVVHGGMMALVLDDIIVNLAWREGHPAVTGELKIRLKKPVKTGEAVYLNAWLEPGENLSKRLFYASAEATNEAGEVLVSAKGTCVRLNKTIN